MKTKLTALIAYHDKNIDQYLKVCKEIGVTHWIHLFTGNQIRSHFRKYGSPKIALISERIGAEYGVNLAQELKNAGCDNIVLFIPKKDPVKDPVACPVKDPLKDPVKEPDKGKVNCLL